MIAALVIDRFRKRARIDHSPNCCDRIHDITAELGRKRNLTAAPGSDMVNASSLHNLLGHFLNAHGLCGELQIVMGLGSAWTMLVLNRIRGATHVEFDDVAPPNQTKLVRPDGQGSFDSNSRSNFITGIVNTLVGRMAAHGMDIFIKHMLDVNQRALPWTVAVVLQRRNHNRLTVRLVHVRSAA